MLKVYSAEYRKYFKCLGCLVTLLVAFSTIQAQIKYYTISIF